MMRHAVAALCLACLPTAAATSDVAPIKVGLMLDMEGPYALIAGEGSLHAADMAIEDVGGSVDGRPVEVVYADHDNSVERARDIARDWLENDRVDMIAEVVGSSTALAVQEINQQHEAVLVLNAVVSNEVTNEACTPTSFHWMYDSYMFSRAVARLAADRDRRDWYVLHMDNAYGEDLLAQIRSSVEAYGGSIIGTSAHALGDGRMLRQMLEAEQAEADVLAIASAGDDLQSAIKQAYDLHSVSRGDMLVTPVAATIPNIREAGLGVTQGMILTTPFYWDQDAASREFSMRFYERHGRKPSEPQAGVYSGLIHYFEAVEATGNVDGPTVADVMRARPVNDPVVSGGELRADGRLVQDIQLVQMKAPTDSEHEWDVAEIIDTVAGDEAFKPLSQSKCDLVETE
ncbi:ABC transporter substrate-binding protein [Aquisalimonas sp.]|uniref:ABC transporter substrate-binding protein n=1 Tax=unclassified Aquisalimonas TaxID=2644645 RepID=UPI0025B9A462|nr:ABC transporter substrate-binding protein [Aquisalimonas sp.]